MKKSCYEKYGARLNSIVLKSIEGDFDAEENEEYKKLSVLHNKCISEEFLLILIGILLFPFIAEGIYFFKNGEIDLDLFLTVGKFSLLFQGFFLIWYLTIRYSKYVNGSYLAGFVFALFVYCFGFFIYFNFDSFFMYLAN